MATRDFITADELRETVIYIPETGEFFRKWKTPNRNTGPIGSLSSRGYLEIGVNGARYLAHRLAWLHVHGVWPIGVIDHINRVQTDNRIANLRDVSQAENNLNRPRTYGYAGKFRDGWRAQINIQKQRHTKTFKSENEARLWLSSFQ